MARKGKYKFSIEELAAKAMEYGALQDFYTNSRNYYQSACKRGVLQEITRHMNRKRTPYDLEQAKIEMMEYHSITDLIKNNRSLYNYINKNKLTEYLKRTLPSGYTWTDEEIRAEALKFKTKKEFVKNNQNAYAAAGHRGILNEVCSHMDILWQKRWTKKIILQEVSKYSTMGDIIEKRMDLYQAISKYKLFGAVKKIVTRKTRSRYTNKELFIIAKSYDNKTEWRIKSPGSYSAALKRGLIKKASSHMTPLGNLGNRFIYSIEFCDKSVYVGLTWNCEERYGAHKNGIIKKKNIGYKFKIHKQYPMSLAGDAERRLYNKYKKSGWLMLNIASPGGLGGKRRKWTLKRLIKEARYYGDMDKFRKHSPLAYRSACKYKLLVLIQKELCGK